MLLDFRTTVVDVQLSYIGTGITYDVTDCIGPISIIIYILPAYSIAVRFAVI